MRAVLPYLTFYRCRQLWQVAKLQEWLSPEVSSSSAHWAPELPLRLPLWDRLQSCLHSRFQTSKDLSVEGLKWSQGTSGHLQAIGQILYPLNAILWQHNFGGSALLLWWPDETNYTRDRSWSAKFDQYWVFTRFALQGGCASLDPVQGGLESFSLGETTQ